jgi:hypothetical protein
MLSPGLGLFYRSRPKKGLVVDVMLTLDVEWGERRPVLFPWQRGKSPDVVIELVTEQADDDPNPKAAHPLRGSPRYSAIFGPQQALGEGQVVAFEQRADNSDAIRLDRAWFPTVFLGLTAWEGTYDNKFSTWLRWCDEQGNLIPTPDERAERLSARLRELGINPDEV